MDNGEKMGAPAPHGGGLGASAPSPYPCPLAPMGNIVIGFIAVLYRNHGMSGCRPVFGVLCSLNGHSIFCRSLRCVVKMKKKNSNHEADLATVNSFGVRGGYSLQRDLADGPVVTV